MKAQFLVDGQTTRAMTLLDETVRVSHFEDCVYLEEEQIAGRIAMGEAEEKKATVGSTKF